MSSQMDVSDILRMKKRLRTKNEADSLKIKQRRSSTEKDVGSLGLKEELEGDWFVEDEENDGTGYVEDDDEQDVDGDNDEGGEEDEGRYDEDEGGDVEDEGDEEEDRNHLSRQVTHGFHLVEGKMDHPMKDCIVAKNRKVIGHDVGLYAIFDGHSGHKVAEYLQSHLFDRILNERDFWTSPKEAIKRAYRDTDDEILDSVVGSRGGSTAVTAILVDGEKLLVANVGDSRAILCRNGEAKQVTVDHEPQKEKQQVESRGGFVSQMPGNVPRVDGQLAMARAFGDERLKEHITAEPDIFVETIDANTDFIILASDGVWKVMSNQEAADSIKGLSDAQEASKELIKEALSRKSRDDISCIVVMFS